MTADGVIETAGRQVEDPVEQGREHHRRILLIEHCRGSLQGRQQSQIGSGCQSQGRHGHRHEEAGRHTLATDITDGEDEPVIVEHENVIEIAADGARGLHVSEHVTSIMQRQRVEVLRQHGALDQRGTAHFVALAPLLRDVLGKAPKCGAEIPNLGDRVAERVQDCRIEFVLFKRRKTAGIESQSAVHVFDQPTQLPDHRLHDLRNMAADS